TPPRPAAHPRQGVPTPVCRRPGLVAPTARGLGPAARARGTAVVVGPDGPAHRRVRRAGADRTVLTWRRCLRGAGRAPLTSPRRTGRRAAFDPADGGAGAPSHGGGAAAGRRAC